MNELVAIWERLRIMNRSLEEDLRQNEADMMNTLNGWDLDSMHEEYLAIRAKQEQLNEIMAIVEGMMGVLENKFKVGDKVRVIKVDYLDEDVIEAGDVFIVEKAYISDEEPKAYIDITTKDGTDWCLYEWQVELVEDDKETIIVESRKTNYIQDTIELLEEDLLEAKHKLEEHYKAVEKAEWLLENKEWIEHDHKDLVHSIQDAIDALRKV